MYLWYHESTKNKKEIEVSCLTKKHYGIFIFKNTNTSRDENTYNHEKKLCPNHIEMISAPKPNYVHVD